MEYRWAGVVEDFEMPLDVRMEGAAGGGGAPDGADPRRDACMRIHPRNSWQILSESNGPSDVGVDRDYYVGVRRVGSDGEPAATPPRSVCGG